MKYHERVRTYIKDTIKSYLVLSNIGFTQKCEVIFKLDGFFNLSDRYFRLNSVIRFGYLSLMLLLRVDT